MIRLKFLIILFALSLASNSVLRAQQDTTTRGKTLVKLIEKIPGKWKMTGVLNNQGTDVTVADTTVEQSIEFNIDGRYVKRNDKGFVNKGSYRINEEHSFLYLQPEEGATAVEWNIVSLTDDRLVLRRRNSSYDKRYQYVYSRVEDK